MFDVEDIDRATKIAALAPMPLHNARLITILKDQEGTSRAVSGLCSDLSQVQSGRQNLSSDNSFGSFSQSMPPVAPESVCPKKRETEMLNCVCSWASALLKCDLVFCYSVDYERRLLIPVCSARPQTEDGGMSANTTPAPSGPGTPTLLTPTHGQAQHQWDVRPDSATSASSAPGQGGMLRAPSSYIIGMQSYFVFVYGAHLLLNVGSCFLWPCWPSPCGSMLHRL